MKWLMSLFSLALLGPVWGDVMIEAEDGSIIRLGTGYNVAEGISLGSARLTHLNRGVVGVVAKVERIQVPQREDWRVIWPRRGDDFEMLYHMSCSLTVVMKIAVMTNCRGGLYLANSGSFPAIDDLDTASFKALERAVLASQQLASIEVVDDSNLDADLISTVGPEQSQTHYSFNVIDGSGALDTKRMIGPNDELVDVNVSWSGQPVEGAFNRMKGTFQASFWARKPRPPVDAESTD